MRRFAWLATVFMSMAVAACQSLPGETSQLDELERTTPTGSAFTQALSREYLAFSRSERDRSSWGNSQHFAEKGLVAAHGTAVPPEALADWGVDDNQAGHQLAEARLRLAEVLAGPAPAHLPALTATAQVKFDCWVRQQHDGVMAESACHKDFAAAMTAIEIQVKKASTGRIPANAPASSRPSDQSP